MSEERTVFIDGIQFDVPEHANVVMIKSNHGNHTGWNRKYDLLETYPDMDKAKNDFLNYVGTLSDNFIVKNKIIIDGSISDDEVVFTYGDRSFEYDLCYYYIDYIEDGCFLENKLSGTSTPLSSIMKKSGYYDVVPEYKLLIDSHHGKYIPQMFFDVLMKEKAFTLENYLELDEEIDDISSPDREHYWEAWEIILDNARVIIENEVYLLYQGEDGDIFLYKEDYDLI